MCLQYQITDAVAIVVEATVVEATDVPLLKLLMQRLQMQRELMYPATECFFCYNPLIAFC